jgi:L-2-hydroxyglutarate oxidase
LKNHFDVAVIGGGILGSSIAYFLASTSDASIAVVEQENKFGMHASRRNTGRVHAPFLYDPEKRKLTARTALKGFEMLKEYCNLNLLPFKEDDVLEVATSEIDVSVLDRYRSWGYKNGLTEDQLKFLSSDEVSRLEPNVKCHAALICRREAATDYGQITKQLIYDAEKSGCALIPDSKFMEFSPSTKHLIIKVRGSKEEFTANYIINAAGGNSLDIAHTMDLAKEFNCLYFRGEYWQAPQQYSDLTKRSIYSVPKYAEYPFLDPHWIVRVDGRREIGPNAVPVISPYSYNWMSNLSSWRKIFDSSPNLAIFRLLTKSDFLQLASREFWSSLSKRAMINRVRQFLPSLKPSAFTKRGVAGVRSSLIGKTGEFVPEMLIVENDYSLHILNYNSPGATGALPIAAKIVWGLIENGQLPRTNDKKSSLWNIDEISASIN